MEPGRFKHVTIVGAGLLGGSAGLAIKAWDPKVHVVGVGRRRSSLVEALDVGAIDTACLDLAEAVAETDLVLLATPVGAFSALLEQLAGKLGPETLVTDVGSTKAQVVAQAEAILGDRANFVGSHPMAGSERKGPAFARADLFLDATCILTPTETTPESVADDIEGFWQALGMQTLRMAPEAHDTAAARVSHLPHALASLLMQLPGDADLPVSATGFRDATRLAGGDPEMWRDIFLTNRQAVVDALDAFGRRLQALRDQIAQGDAEKIEAFLAQARDRRQATIGRRFSDRRVAFE
jgi:prephenate dehydrogenase